MRRPAGATALQNAPSWVLVPASVLLIAWSLAVPVFEGPDEPAHWQYARYFHVNLQPPPFNEDFIEGIQPPLYYALVAALAFSADVPPRLTWRDGIGVVRDVGRPRLFQNDWRDFSRYWPIRLMRLVSVALSLLTVWFVFRTAVAAGAPRDAAVMAAGGVAFLPQFTFRGMNVTSDVLVTTLSALCVWLFVRLLREGFQWRLALMAGLATSAAIMAKLIVFPFVGLFAGTLVICPGQPASRLRRLWALAVPVVCLMPLAWRNTRLYGDPLVAGAMNEVMAPLVDPHPLFSLYFIRDFPYYMWRSFIGLFGWMNILMPEWVYNGYLGLIVLALAGFVLAVKRRRVSVPIVLLLVATCGVALAATVGINLGYTQPQGRYMFPALAALGTMFGIGLSALPGWRPVATRVLLVTLAVANGISLWKVVVPHYWPPATPPLSEARLRLDLSPRSDASHVVAFGTNERAPAGRYCFVQFDLAGISSVDAVTGEVEVQLVRASETVTIKHPFQWRPDGTCHRITVPLCFSSQWDGDLAALRVAPAISGADQFDATLRLGATELVGNLGRSQFHPCSRVTDTCRSAEES